MAIAGGVVALGTAGYSIINSENERSATKKEIGEFQRQDLVNPFNVPISTEAEEFQKDAGLSSQATSVAALQRGGTREVLAGIPRLSESNVLLNNKISASIDEKSARRDEAIARGEQRNQDIQEIREQQALQGLGQANQVANQNLATGVTNLVSGGLSLASAIDPVNGGVNFNENSPLQNGVSRQTLDPSNFKSNVAPVTTQKSLFTEPASSLFQQELSPEANKPFFTPPPPEFNPLNPFLFKKI